MELITIAAIVLAPLLAFSVQWILQFLREKRERKIWIFRALMSTRLSILSHEHVNALNLIDLEFKSNRQKDKTVRQAWHTYLDHLNTQRSPNDVSLQQIWDNKSADLRSQLLYSMLRKALIRDERSIPGIPRPGKLQDSISNYPTIARRIAHDELVDSLKI